MTNNERILDRLIYVLVFSFLFLASSFFMVEILVRAKAGNGNILGARTFVKNR